MPLEKNVENLLNFVTVLGGPASQPAAHSGAWPTARECAARSPRPGRNLGLGLEFGPVADTPWASSGPKPRASLRAVG